MACEWRETSYGDVAADFSVESLRNLCDPHAGIQTGPFGSQLHQKDYVHVGTPIITVEHLGENRILHEELPRVCDEDRKRLSRYLLCSGDIVFSRVGSVDRRALVRDTEDGWMFSGRCLRIRPNPDKIDSCYLSYFFGLPAFKEHIRAIAVGATMPSLNTSILSDIIIPYPLNIREQRAIGHILGTLDDKIELNRKMNQTLEEMAKTIFKSWFVDFDPVRAKMEGRSTGLPQNIEELFPENFEDSELGEVPAGWGVKVLDHLVAEALGGDWGNDSASNTAPMAARCIRGADIPDLQLGGKGKMPIRYLKPTSLQKRQLQHGDIVVEISGGSPTQSTGRAVLVTDKLLRRLDASLACSNFCRFIKLKKPAYSKFVYLWLRKLYTNDELLQFENGTTGIKNFAFTLFSSSYKVCVPPEILLEKFDELNAPLFDRLQSSADEADTLGDLRDTLLPKLISGELRVKEADKAVWELA